MSECLDDKTLVAFLEGRCDEQTRARVHAHMDVCESCRELLGAVAQGLDLAAASGAGADDGADDDSATHARLRGASSVHGRYRILGECGRGGQARVLRAHDLITDREVALKELLPRAPATGGKPTPPGRLATVRFLREARITAKLPHPAIVPVYDIGEREDGSVYYTMKLVRGRTLAEAIAECRTLHARLQLLGHFLDVCNAIAFAHGRGVVHRDLKPQNVIVGEFGESILLDWGLAKARGSDEALLDGETHDGCEDGQTINGTAIGTPAYMSPEQALGRIPDIDERSDIFGLGALLYELLSGQRPFTGSSADRVTAATQGRAPKPLRELVEDAPAELVAITEKAMALDKSNRYQRAADMAAEIRAYLTGGRVRAYEYTSWELLQRFVSKNRGLIAVVLVIIAAAAATLVAVAWALTRENAQRHTAERALERAEASDAAARRQAAAAALAQGDLLQARAQLRGSLELADSVGARALWWRLQRNPLLWKLSTGSHMTSTTVARDGRAVALATQDGSVYLVDLASGKRRFLGSAGDQATALAFSPKDDFIAVATWSGRLRFVPTRQGARLPPIDVSEPRTLSQVAFNVDGTLLATACETGLVEVWDVPTATRLTRIQAHQQALMDIVFSPREALFATSSVVGELKLWELPTGRLRSAFGGEGGAFASGLAFNRDGSVLASVFGSTLRLLRVADGIVERELSIGGRSGNRLAFAPSGDMLAVGQKDGIISIIDTGRGATVRRLVDTDASIEAVAFASAGELVSVGRDGVLRVWNAGLTTTAPAAARSQVSVDHVAVSPSGDSLVSAGPDGTVRAWDVKAGRVRWSKEIESLQIPSVAYSPDGTLVAVAGGHRVVRLFDADKGLERELLLGLRGTSMGVAFSPSGDRLVAADSTGSVAVWDVREASLRLRYDTMKRRIYRLRLMPDGRRFAVGTRDGEVLLCSLEREDCVVLPSRHNGTVFSVAATRGGAILSAGEDGIVRVTDAQRVSSRTLFDIGARVYEVALSPDEMTLAVAAADRRVHVCSMKTELCTRIEGHGGEVNSVSWTPDGSTIASAGDDGSVRLWWAEDGRPRWHTSAWLEATGEAFTQHGWSAPIAPPVNSLADSLRRMIEEEARWVVMDDSGETVCVQRWDGTLVLFYQSGGQGGAQSGAPASEPLQLGPDAQVLGLRHGCATLAAGEVRLFTASGGNEVLASGARGLSRSGDDVLVLQGTILLVFDDAFGLQRAIDVGPRTSAALEVGGSLIVGGDDGSIESLALEEVSGGGGEHLSLQQTMPSRVAVLAAGPPGVVAAGYASGAVGLWDLANGLRLDSAELHGPVIHIGMRGSTLVALTALGDLATWDMKTFSQSYCETLDQVWRAVPVVWNDGDIDEQEPPTQHPCRR